MDYNAINVLLVEDNLDEAELAMRQLKKNRMNTRLLHIKDGEEALDFIFATGKYDGLRDLQHSPDLILLDIQMPKLNGIEVLEKIKGDERTRSIPVVVLTSSNQNPNVQRCYELGANSYIVKPIGIENYTEALKRLGIYWQILNIPPG